MFKYFLIGIIVLAFASCKNKDTGTDPDITVPHNAIPAPTAINYSVINTFPHDTSAYTQGLEFYKGKLYESTGDYENSSLRLTDVTTGKVLQSHKMGSTEIFGEGITILNDKIYQLTWQSHTVYVYDLSDINKPVKTFSWPYEGWGITHNDSTLVISDGTSNIYFVNPNTFNVVNTISVQDNAGAVAQLNELEFVDGFIWANVYMSNRIVKIDPASGQVKAQMLITNLLLPTDVIQGRTDVLNGLAWNDEKKTMFITGKRWPKMFELKLN